MCFEFYLFLAKYLYESSEIVEMFLFELYEVIGDSKHLFRHSINAIIILIIVIAITITIITTDLIIGVISVLIIVMML